MKKRILAAAVLLPLLFIVLYAAPKWVMALAVGIICSIGAYELLFNTGILRHGRLTLYSMATAFLVPLWCYFGAPFVWGMAGFVVFFCLIFMEIMLSDMKLTFSKASICFVGGLLLPYMLSALVRIMVTPDGRALILIPFVAAFLSDTGGYFIGCRFGKHRLAPVISPKKSVEGLFGGLAFSVVGMLLYVLLLQLAFGYRANFAYAVAYAILGALAGVFGDLCFSVIKRQTGIKDFSNLIPGHGGALDRFDSILLAGPVVEVLLALIPVVVKS